MTTNRCVENLEEDGFILVSGVHKCAENAAQNESHKYLSEIDNCIEGLGASLWPLNSFIHENPELAFEEHKAHDVLTTFLRSQKYWQVTTSAYGMKTAWVAVYDSGKIGPAVSLNVEMGMPNLHRVQGKRLR